MFESKLIRYYSLCVLMSS